MPSAKRAARLPATIRCHKSGRPQLSRSSLDTCAAHVSSKSRTAISGTLSRPGLLTPTQFPISRPNIAGGVYITTEGGGEHIDQVPASPLHGRVYGTPCPRADVRVPGGKVGDPGGRGPIGQGGGPQASSHHLFKRVPALLWHSCDFEVTIL